MDRVTVRDPTDVATARRRIVGLAAQLGYDETAAGRVAIVVTELAQNLVRHGGGGEILAGADAQHLAGLEILAWDRRPRGLFTRRIFHRRYQRQWARRDQTPDPSDAVPLRAAERHRRARTH